MRANKIDPREIWGSFFSLGYFKNLLKTQGSLGELKGNGGYLGIGWEFPFEILGLAFEIAQRQISMENNLFIKTPSPSTGVHFYKHLLSKVKIVR